MTINKKQKFVVTYYVGGSKRKKTILSTLDNCDVDADKISTKWDEVIIEKYNK